MNRVVESSLPYLVRPATRIERSPLPDLSDQELLALLIGGAYASSDAGLLLQAIGGDLKLLYTASLDELARSYSGVGYHTAKRLKAALELGRRLAAPSARDQLTCPKDCAGYFTRMGLPLCEQEELWAAALDTKKQVLSLAKVYRGNVNSSIIRASEVFRDAVRHNAVAVVIAHNHPSGDPTPSSEDVQTTRSLREAAALLGIDLLDHLIVCPGRWVALRDITWTSTAD
ncbi:MAG: DNA repair protein RadC [Anaerolineae bacterium]|nr:DNA repair protein RadC [Anaerolineae bacterium]